MATSAQMVRCPHCGKEVTPTGNACPACEKVFPEGFLAPIQAKQSQLRKWFQLLAERNVFIFIFGTMLGICAIISMLINHFRYSNDPLLEQGMGDLYPLPTIFGVMAALALLVRRPVKLAAFFRGLFLGALVTGVSSGGSILVIYLFFKYVLFWIFPNGLIPH